jgi:hypothetical protein
LLLLFFFSKTLSFRSNGQDWSIMINFWLNP